MWYSAISLVEAFNKAMEAHRSSYGLVGSKKSSADMYQTYRAHMLERRAQLGHFTGMGQQGHASWVLAQKA
jgi:hypothetical protein